MMFSSVVTFSGQLTFAVVSRQHLLTFAQRMFWLQLPDVALCRPGASTAGLLSVHAHVSESFVMIDVALRFKRACSPPGASLLLGCPTGWKFLLRNATPGAHVDTVKNRWGSSLLTICLLRLWLRFSAQHVPSCDQLQTPEARMKLFYMQLSFFSSRSVTALTRAKLQASPLCASPPRRAKPSCCVRARKPKTHRTATVHTLTSSSAMWRNQWKAFLNLDFQCLGPQSPITDIYSTYWIWHFVPLLRV